MYPTSCIRDLQIGRRTSYTSGYDQVSREQRGAESNPVSGVNPAWEVGDG